MPFITSCIYGAKIVLNDWIDNLLISYSQLRICPLPTPLIYCRRKRKRTPLQDKYIWPALTFLLINSLDMFCQNTQCQVCLRCVCRCNWLRDTRDLVSSSDDLLPCRVTDKGYILVLPLCPLPDLHFTTSSKNTYSHCRQQVVSRIGVVIDTAVEHSSSILSDTRSDQGLSTGMILDEVGNIVNNTCNWDESPTILCLLLVGLPVDDRKLL